MIFLKRNGTEWQNYTINTGYENVADVAKVVAWNGKK